MGYQIQRQLNGTNPPSEMITPLPMGEGPGGEGIPLSPELVLAAQLLPCVVICGEKIVEFLQGAGPWGLYYDWAE